MSRLNEMAEGWINNLTPQSLLNERIVKMANKRMSVCNACEFISTKHSSIRPDVHCTICSCTLSAKTKSSSSACPKDKWGIENLDI